MSDKLTTFLGDSLGRTIIKLLIISFVVGIIMSALNFTPWDVWYGIRDFFISIYNLGFDALGKIGKYFLLGAGIVVPVFLIIRFLNFKK
jgi:uncharacterized membrane protein